MNFNRVLNSAEAVGVIGQLEEPIQLTKMEIAYFPKEVVIAMDQ